jgi:hypothetical protein
VRDLTLCSIALFALAIAYPKADTPGPPTVKTHGQATVEYRDNRVHCVAAYDYSQRSHSEPWLFMDFAIRTADRIAIHRREFKIVTPEEREIPMASQVSFLEHAPLITRLRQNSRIWKRPLDVFFRERDVQRYQFFALPSDGTVVDEIVSGDDGVSTVSLFFESPTGHWENGSYRLVLDGGRVHASLPVELR